LTFYIPNAEAAVRAALNRGRTGLSASFSNNRLTPMFGIYSQAEQSHLFTSSPQIALGVLTNSAGATSVGESIVGYPQFSGRNCDNTLTSCKTASARAMFSLFATENAPAGAILQPLYRLVKGGSKAYLTDFQKALALERDGYAMEVVEGYVYEATQSRPTGTVSLCTATDSARRDVILYVSNSACDQTRLTYGNSMTTGGNYANNTLLGYVHPLQPTQTTAPPNAGWWWRADESGRGFFIEQQGHTVFVSGYLYEADGRPTWFIATGKAENGEFLGKIQTASGGQALNGPYRVPTVRETNDQIRLKFDGQERAQLSWPGGATTITRFDYGGSGRQSLPDSGWWWAENESGRGYSIEIQGDTLFFAAYMYNDRGEPVWYTAAGKLSDGKRFSGDLLLSESGQAMTAPYRAPTTRSIGAIKLVFDSATKGLLTLPDGRDLVISRFKFSEY
jgi:serine protease